MREKFTSTTHDSHSSYTVEPSEDYRLGPYVTDASLEGVRALGDLPSSEINTWKSEQGIPESVDVMTARVSEERGTTLYALNASAEDFGTLDRRSTQAMEQSTGDKISEALEHVGSEELQRAAADHLRTVYGASAAERHQDIIESTKALGERLADTEHSYGPEAYSITGGVGEQLRQETSGYRQLDLATFMYATQQLAVLAQRQRGVSADLPRVFEEAGDRLMEANQNHDQRVRSEYEEAAQIDTRLDAGQGDSGVLASTIIESLGRDTLVNDATAEIFSEANTVNEARQRGMQYADQLDETAQLLRRWAERAQGGEVQLSDLRRVVEAELVRLEEVQRGAAGIGSYAQTLQEKIAKVKSVAFSAST